MTPVKVSLATWHDVWPEAESLMAAHRDELDRDSRRPFRVNTAMAEGMDRLGAMTIHQARQDGQLVGYIFWYLSPALDSADTVMAAHGPWYVEPRLRPWRVGARLWQMSVKDLVGRGIGWALPHHYESSPELGEFYRKLGAKPLEHTYLLDLSRYSLGRAA